MALPAKKCGSSGSFLCAGCEGADAIENKLGSDIPEEQKRFFAVKLLEKDDKIREQMRQVPDVSAEIEQIEKRWMMIRKVLSQTKGTYIFLPLSVRVLQQ